MARSDSPETPPRLLRNLGIIAHIDAGKTTTTERILYYAGVTHGIGEVDDGSTQLDWMDEERERGITITAAATRVHWGECDINLIDTPGHVDFTAEVERSLRVLDGAVVVLCAVGGVEAQTEMVWQQAARYGVPCVFFVNKMDRVGADFDAVVEEIEQRLGVRTVVTHLPVGAEDKFSAVIDLFARELLVWDAESRGREIRRSPIPSEEIERAATWRAKMLESTAAEDDALLARYLEGAVIERPEFERALRSATLSRRLFPVLAGASLRDIGIQPLLDAAVAYLPSPVDARPALATRAAEAGDVDAVLIERPCDANAELLALVFKTFTERERGRASYVRIYAGVLREGSTVLTPRLGGTERIARLFRVHADKRTPVDHASAGDIVVVTGIRSAATGDTLCQGEPLLLAGMQFPPPVVAAALEASSSADEEKLQFALQKLSGDDPTFEVKIDETTGQTVISGMGELHLEILGHRLTREFGVRVRMGRPQVTYRETISRATEAPGRFDRFTAGRQHTAELTLRVGPLPRGAGFRFEDRSTQGVLPAAMLHVVERACRDAAESGVRWGYPLTDLEAILLEAGYSEHDGSELAFRSAALEAFRDACRGAVPLLLEPIVSLEIVAPRDTVGGVMAALASRGGHITGNEMGEQSALLHGEAPLSRMFGFTTDLRSASQGRATCAMVFARFDLASEAP